jgi:hypothetical protein
VVVVAGFALWSISKEDFRRTDLDKPAAAFICLSLLSIFYSPDIYAAIYGIKMILAAATVYYLSSQFLRRSDYRIIITNIIIILGAIISAVVYGQIAYNAVSGKTVLVDAFFPNQNLLAGYMVIPFALMLSKILFEKKISFLWLKVAAVALFISINIIIPSRGGLLSMIFVFILMWLYYRYHMHNVKDTPARKKFKSILLRVMLVVFIASAFTGFTPAGEKLTNISNNPFYFNRLQIYAASIKMMAGRIVAGWGIGSYGTIFSRYNFPINAPYRYMMTTQFAHNELLQAGAELGLAGLILALIMAFVILRSIPLYEGHRKLWAAGAGSYFALCGICFHSMFDFNLHLPGILLTSAVLASIVVEQRSAISTVTKEALVFTKVHYLPALILSAVLFSLAIRPAASTFMYTLYKDGYSWALEAASQAEPLNPAYTYETGLNYEKQGDCTKALAWFKKTSAYDSYNTDALIHSARSYACLGDLPSAREQYRLAVEANPFKAMTYEELGEFADDKLKDHSVAEDNMRKAVDLEPNFVRARFYLSQVYTQKGDYASALDQLNTAEYILNHTYPLNDQEKSLLEFPGIDLIYFSKALVYLNLKDHSSSCEYIKKAESLKKNDVYSSFARKNCGGR